VVGVTVFFGVIGWFYFDLLQKMQYPLMGFLVLVVGLPHGATDYLLYKRMKGPVVGRWQAIRFFIYYLLMVFGYLVCWVFFPKISLIFFLVISAYHFGQSNGQYLQLPRWLASILYVSWGIFVLGAVLLWHWEESRVVIGQLLGRTPEWSVPPPGIIPVYLFFFTAVLLLLLWGTNYISSNNYRREMTNLLVLSFTLYYTPLLVGFTLYFTLWHSLGSLLHQVTFFRGQWPGFTYFQYYRQAAPHTLLAVFGLFGLVICQSYLFSNVSLVSLFFVLIACVSLPHIFLIEKSFMQGRVVSNDAGLF
jgi:Brp/Blh family beta-carotene 15,15'-monooxygenase